jgi:ABC-type uncharacterized transport system permease subunit
MDPTEECMKTRIDPSLWLVVGSLAIVIGVSEVIPTLAMSIVAIAIGNVCLARVWIPGLRDWRKRHRTH